MSNSRHWQGNGPRPVYHAACALCGRTMLFIGFREDAPPALPALCAQCACCRAQEDPRPACCMQAGRGARGGFALYSDGGKAHMAEVELVKARANARPTATRLNILG